MNRIITVSREFGSGGRTIAKIVGGKLQLPVYDNELLTQIAQKSGFAKEYIEEKSENTTWGAFLSNSLSKLGSYYETTAEDYLWSMQREVIIKLAQKEPCVIVGRCADYILKDKADCLRIFIYSQPEKRTERIASVYGSESTESPQKRMRDKDKRRSAFYNYHTDMTWGDPHNYHLCLDSGVLGLEKCADIICSVY